MSTAFDIAQRRVDEFESLMSAREQAMDSKGCNDHLLLGIEAFRWLEHVKQQSMQTLATDRTGLERAHDRLTALYAMWLRPCAGALKWAQSYASHDTVISNYRQFCACYEKAQAFLDASAMESMQDDLELSSANGETVRALLGQ